MLVSIYMTIVLIRIVLTWFSWMGNSGIQDTLAKITDPYINWFRRFPILRTGFLDFSTIAALGVLSLVSRIFGMLAVHGSITIGLILAMILQAIWGIVSFLIVFVIIVLILRLGAHFLGRNSGGALWRIIDGVSQPVLFNINRTLFQGRLTSFSTAMFASIVILGLGYFILRTLVFLIVGMLARLPF